MSARTTRRSAKRTSPTPRARDSQWLDQLITRQAPSFTAFHLPEPTLAFADGVMAEDPKTGLAISGPFGASSAPDIIRVGIIGDGESIGLVRDLLRKLQSPVYTGGAEDLRLAPDFPGFSEQSPWRCQFDVAKAHVEHLAGIRLAQALAVPNAPTRIGKVIELFEERLAVLADRDPIPDVVICAVPGSVEAVCRRQFKTSTRKQTPKERAEARFNKKSQRTGQLTLSLSEEPDNDNDAQTKDSWDFHNALKAKAMAFNLPTQLVWHSTLAAPTKRQDDATLSWNLSTALYYKAGNVPWSLADLPTNTAFLGIAFYRESRQDGADLRTALAQVFSQSGEGLILRGEPAHVDTEGDRQPHLAKSSGQKLVRSAVELYEKHHGHRPGRIVIHKTSRYYPDELEGFKAGLDGVSSFDFLTLETRGIRLFRTGHEPPLRGTVIQLARRNYVVYTAGYVPQLGMYPGPRVPIPVEVLEHHGDSSAEKVCAEILALTKLNWNTAAFYSKLPITIAFAQDVGQILRDLPAGRTPLAKYRFYM